VGNADSNLRGLSALANAFSDRPLFAAGGRRGVCGIPFCLDEAVGDPIIASRHSDHPFAILEPLEARQLMSVSVDGGGFTIVTPAADSRIIYVSSSGGSDSNNGLSPAKPVKTLAKGVGLIRNGSADQLLLKRGDTWRESFGRWTKSGRSASEPVLISAYGVGDRPLIRSGTDDGIGIGSASAKTINHLAIVGIHFWADGRDPVVSGYDRYALNYGINVIAGGTGLLIEDVKVEKYMTNICFTPYLGEMRDVAIRRSIIVDAYDVGNSHLHAQGLFADGVRGLTLHQNIFDHNGWLSSVSGAKATIYNHNAYITANTSRLVATGNIFSNASSHGLQDRAGGIVTGNLFLNNPIGLSYGLVNGSGVTTKGGVSGQVSDNVFLGGRDISGQDRGIAIQAGNIRGGSGTHFSGNIFSNYPDASLPAIMLEYGVGVSQADAVGINDLTLADNIVHNWVRGLSVGGDMSPTAVTYKRIRNVVLKNNRFSEIGRTVLVNDRYLTADSISRAQTGAGQFPAPDRTLSTYNQSLGGYNAEWQFMVAARDRDGGQWDARYAATAAVNYVRGGFGMSALSVGGDTTVPPAVPPVPPPPLPPAVPPTVPPVVPPPVVPPTVPPAVPPAPVPDPVTPPADDVTTAPIPKSETAVAVKAVRFTESRRVQRLTVKFSRDVGESLDVTDLTFSALDGQTLPAGDVTLQWKARTRTAIWTFVREASARLARGLYGIHLSADGIVDDNGRKLDGNRDRKGGDHFTSQIRVKRD